MAIYRLSAQVISRSGGKSAVASAAYRSGESLRDERLGQTWDYTRRETVAHAAILAPEDAPAWALDREQLWNQVEASEKRKDSQLCREFQLAVPVELCLADQVHLVESWVREELVARGMVADVTLHADQGNPHAHVLATTRTIGPDGFGKKEREWNRVELLEDWRASWAVAVNRGLERAGIMDRVSHLSLEAQGIDREPKNLSRDAYEMEQRGIQTRQGNAYRERLRRRALEAQRSPALRLRDRLARREAAGWERERDAYILDTLEQVQEAIPNAPEPPQEALQEPSGWARLRSWAHGLLDSARRVLEARAEQEWRQSLRRDPDALKSPFDAPQEPPKERQAPTIQKGHDRGR